MLGIRDELLSVHSGESESLVFLFFFYNGGTFGNATDFYLGCHVCVRFKRKGVMLRCVLSLFV